MILKGSGFQQPKRQFVRQELGLDWFDFDLHLGRYEREMEREIVLYLGFRVDLKSSRAYQRSV